MAETSVSKGMREGMRKSNSVGGGERRTLLKKKKSSEEGELKEETIGRGKKVSMERKEERGREGEGWRGAGIKRTKKQDEKKVETTNRTAVWP